MEVGEERGGEVGSRKGGEGEREREGRLTDESLDGFLVSSGFPTRCDSFFSIDVASPASIRWAFVDEDQR